MKKLLISTLVTAFLLGSLTSCEQISISNTITAENLMATATKSDIAISGALEEQDKVALMEFYCKLLTQTHQIESEGQENIMISPLSIATALSMTGLGADGDTLSEMEEVFGLSKDAMASYLSAYIESLPSTETAEFHLANSIWVKDDPKLTVQDSFLGDNKAYFDPDVFKAPFDSGTLSEINKWTKTNTNGMIDKVLEEIPKEAVLYLINALCFEGEWENTYYEEQVRDRVFYHLDGTETTVDMMYSSESGYLEGESFIGFSKPYKDNTYRFVGLLPEEGGSTDEILAELTANPESFLEQLATSEDFVDSVALPKFEQEFSAELSETLESLGMTSAFDVDLADFAKMGEHTDENIYISQVIHKTYIQVDELGTKAGAVTSGGMSGGGAPSETKEVHLDRPFVYMIVDTEENLPLFMGIINEL
ncbi:MAG: serpin family protein [Eubacteriales bacterium]